MGECPSCTCNKREERKESKHRWKLQQAYLLTEKIRQDMVIPARFGVRKHFVSLRKATKAIKAEIKHNKDDDYKSNKKWKVDKWIDKTPELMKVIRPYLNSKPFQQLSVLFIHHLTPATLGTVSSIRQLGCTNLIAIWIGYNDDAEKAYFPEFSDLPRSEFKTFTIKPNDDEDGNSVELSSSRCQYDKFPFHKFNKIFKENNFGFLEGIRALSSYVLLHYAKDKKFLIIEDGGYISPILNEEALNQLSLKEYCKKYKTPFPSNKELMIMTMDMILDKYMIGSIEHTRNGYDRLKEIEIKYDALYKPNFSIACSYVKTQIESESVSASVLNGAANVLYALGKVMLSRNIIVFGCRGNIGRYIMEQLEHRVSDPEEQIIGCDLKINAAFSSKYYPDGNGLKPEWLISAQEPSTVLSKEIEKFDDLSLEEQLDIDTIIGTTGGAKKQYNCKVFTVDHLILWLCKSAKKDLFLVSASTKKMEFMEILQWIEKNDDDEENKRILNKNDDEYYLMKISSNDIIDHNSKRTYGIHYTFTVNNGITKNVYFFNDGMPINFLFYGVPNEYIDMVMSQLIDISILLAKKHEVESLPNRIFLVDYDPECTKRVYKAFYEEIEPVKHPIKYIDHST